MTLNKNDVIQAPKIIEETDVGKKNEKKNGKENTNNKNGKLNNDPSNIAAKPLSTRQSKRINKGNTDQNDNTSSLNSENELKTSSSVEKRDAFSTITDVL